MADYRNKDTYEYLDEASALPYVSPQPKDPLGGGVTGDMSFGTGPVVLGPSGEVETRHKTSSILPGGITVDGGTV